MQAEIGSGATGRGPLHQTLERHGYTLALVAGLFARVFLITVLFHWGAVPFTSDDATYVRIAERLLAAGRLDSHHFPVGYPIVVALFLKLGAAAFPALRVAHVLFGLATIVVVGRITTLLYGRRTGLIAAWVTALYPPLVFMTGRIMSETLFIALLMTSLHQFLKADKEASQRRTVLAGAIFAVASIIRLNLVAMLPFIPVWLWLRPRTALRPRLVSIVTCMAVAGTIVLLPGLYFLSTKGEFIPFASNAGQTFYGANNPLADGGWIEMENHQELLASIPASVRSSPVAYSKAQQALGVKWIRENPGAFLRLLPKKFGNAWIPGFQSSETTSKSKVAAVMLFVVSGLVLLAALLGRLLVQPAQRDGILLAVLATYTVMSLAFYGNPRIGLFCTPLLIVYASAGINRLLGARQT